MASKEAKTGDTCTCGHRRSEHMIIGRDGSCERCACIGKTCNAFELHYRWGEFEPLAKMKG